MPDRADDRVAALPGERTLRYRHALTVCDGFLAPTPVGPARARGVVVLHPWTGVASFVRDRARRLAHAGYTAFAADLYGAGVRPTHIAGMRSESEKYLADPGLLRRRVQAGFDAFTDHTGLRPEDVIVLGYCFGGTAALEFARSGARCAGVVSVHGTPLLHHPSDAASITAPLLIQTGAEDELVPDTLLAALVADFRTAPELDWQLTVHSGAPHAYTAPGDRYRERADARSWRQLLDFLGEVAPLHA